MAAQTSDALGNGHYRPVVRDNNVGIQPIGNAGEAVASQGSLGPGPGAVIHEISLSTAARRADRSEAEQCLDDLRLDPRC